MFQTGRSTPWPRCPASAASASIGRSKAPSSGPAPRSDPAGCTTRSASTAPASASPSSTRASPASHDDLASGRVVKFADFVNFQPSAYDDYGHGTHVAGIIAGSGYDSGGRPQGHRSRRVAARREGPRRRPAKGSSATSSRRSTTPLPTRTRSTSASSTCRSRPASTSPTTTDPLTLAAKRAVEAGIVVVSAAGNLGRSASGAVAVRRDRRTGQRSLGDYGRRVEPHGNGGSPRRHRRRLQLAWPGDHRLRRQTGSASRPASESSPWPIPAARSS